MKYVFFGSPLFASRVLQKLIDSEIPPMALVCNPDRPVGRHKTITAPLTKQTIQANHLEGSIQIFQPEKLKEILPELDAMHPNFFIVAAYAKILRPEALAIPHLGTIGVHPSLLPKYRGASPIQASILAGETETGVSLYKMGEGVDDGPVYELKEIPVGHMNYVELQAALADLAGDMLVEFLPKFLKGNAIAVKQAESQAILTRKFTQEDGFAPLEDVEAAMAGDFTKSSELYRKIRALNPEPGVWTLKNGLRIKLLNARLDGEALRFLTIQREGKTPEDFRPGLL